MRQVLRANKQSGVVANDLSGFKCTHGDTMKRTELLQEIRKMRFEEAYYGWTERRLTQEEAAKLLGVCDRMQLGPDCYHG